ncbi:MAG: arylsulfatase [Actinobacteria bacterium]|nr:arylsulfatase [Actinomycetota bacterium]
MSEIHRSVLPIPERAHVGLTTFDAKDPETVFPPIEELRPPDGAPNVLIVLVDDVGFGASSPFGGPVDTPTAARLAAGGLRFNRFHTTALCAPTRQAMLTGRNHHSVGMGNITEFATSAPGQTSLRPKSCAPLAETLRLNGYSTAQFGKCHEVPAWQNSPVGPFDAWPTFSGFEHFYGFVAAETNQYYPALTQGTSRIEVPKTPEEGYHFTEDIADQAIGWINQQKALAPDKPFFVYWAPGATHSPHHVAKEWSDKYKGRFSMGWDKLREQTLARQKEMGVVPGDAELTDRSEGIPAWDEMPDELKPILELQMEIYAGFLEHTDHHLGRIVDAIDALGVLDDTLIYYVIGDNGASAEGTLQGTFNEMIAVNGAEDLETPQFLIDKADKFGGPEAYNHYAVGWAHAMDTPYQWTKQVASHWGGTRNGLVVHWPNGIDAAGEIRSQFSHVIDVAPTVLDAAGIPQPDFVNGIQQRPYEGSSMLAAFADDSSPNVRSTQYFEMFGNRGIFHNDWTAVTKHRTPWLAAAQEMPEFDDDVWELYAPGDWSQANDIAADNPEMLHKLQRLWLIEAVKYNVLPLDDRMAERANPDIAGRPQLIKGSRQMLYEGMGRLSEFAVLSLKNKNHAVTAEIEIGDDGASGVIVAQGGVTGGWSLYLHEGVPRYCYNFLGLTHTIVTGSSPVGAGTRQVRVEFDYDGGGVGKGGEVRLYVDGDEVGSDRIERTEPFIFSADETLDLGVDDASAVSPDYTPATSRFDGRVKWVELDIDAAAEDDDHHLTAEERYRVAMAIQ